MSGPLRQIAQDASTGPIPVAAAHAADGLHRLLGVIGGGQVPSVENVKTGVAEMKAARQAFTNAIAIANVDVLLGMLGDLQAVLGED